MYTVSINALLTFEEPITGCRTAIRRNAILHPFGRIQTYRWNKLLRAYKCVATSADCCVKLPLLFFDPQQRWQQHVPTMQNGNAQRALPLSSAKHRVVAPPLIKTTMRAEHYHLLLTMSMWAASWPLPLLPQHRSNVQEIKRSSSRQALSLSSPCFTLQRSANIKFWGGVTICMGTDACLQDNSKL